MKVCFYSSQPYDRHYFEQVNQTHQFDFTFFDASLNKDTAVLAQGADAVCVFVNDSVNRSCLENLSKFGIKHIALRCAGFNNVDLDAAKHLNISVSRVPAYSPQAVAEHTIALILCLSRHIHKAYNRVKENNFNLNGLEGFNLGNKTVGVIGTGKIGKVVSNILLGFGCNVICSDPIEDQELKNKGCTYIALSKLIQEADIITLHCPLTAENQHMIDDDAINNMKRGVTLINTSRGGLVNSSALIKGLKNRKIGFLGLDVYEMESELFFKDHSCEIVQDDVFDRLAGFPNVIITGHQGFFTKEALTEIAQCTYSNLQLAEQRAYNDDSFLVIGY